MKKTAIKIISFIIVLAMGISVLAGCSSSKVMTLNVDGKQYSATLSEYLLFMKVTKLNLFCYTLGVTKEYDKYIWKINVSGTDQTYEQYYNQYVHDLLRTAVIEKYLFDKYGLEISDATLATYKQSIQSSNKSYGGAGAYKQYFGYTASDYYNYYQKATERSKLIINYLYEGENAKDPVTEAEKETYYNENYESYQYIVLDMNNKISKDDEGHFIGVDSSNNEYILSVEKQEDGAVKIENLGRVDGTETDLTKVTIVDFKMTELTDEEKQEKATLSEVIISQLDENNGANFKDLMLEYSDLYVNYEYENGLVISKDGYIINNTSVMEKARALEENAYTEAISVSEGAYTYIIKRMALPEKAYELDEYTNLFTSFDLLVQDYKYGKLLENYREMVVIDEDALSKYTIAEAFLSDYVDYYRRLVASLTGNEN